MYRSVWSYAGINEILKTCVASIVACVLTGVVFSIAIMRMPISFYLIGWILVFGFTASIRMMYRLLRRMRIKADNSKGNTERQNIMIIGAGAAGLVLLREYRNSYYLTDKVKIFIDDNAQKWNKYLDGVLIEGGRDKILESVEKIPDQQKLFWQCHPQIVKIFAIFWKSVKRLTARFRPFRVFISWSTVKSMCQKLRNVEIEDLLGRDPIEVNLDEILGYIKGKTVLVTGGGGSIGSEICTQLAEHEVGHLIIFDIYEK